MSAALPSASGPSGRAVVAAPSCSGCGPHGGSGLRTESVIRAADGRYYQRVRWRCRDFAGRGGGSARAPWERPGAQPATRAREAVHTHGKARAHRRTVTCARALSAFRAGRPRRPRVWPSVAFGALPEPYGDLSLPAIDLE